MLVPTWMGTNMADGNQQRHSVTEFCYKTVKLSLEELINIKVIKVERLSRMIPNPALLFPFSQSPSLIDACYAGYQNSKHKDFFFRVEESSHIILEESREGKGYITACKLLKLFLQKWLRQLA